VVEDGGDVGQQVAAPAQQMGELGVAHGGGGVAAVPGAGVAIGPQQSGALPLAQRRRPEAEAVGQLADGQRPIGIGRRRRVEDHSGGGLDGVERLAVTPQLGVAVVERGQGAVEVAPVHGHHGGAGGGVAVGGDEGEEGVERIGVGRPVAAVAGPTAGRRGQEAIALVVAHGLGGDAARAGQVDGAQGLHLGV
jgi:hypothetical protein